MTIVNSKIASQNSQQEATEVGTLFFFNHLAVVKFNDGIHVGLNSGRHMIYALLDYFGNSKPFGIVANKVNLYAIALLEIAEVRSIFPNVIAYGIVSQFCTSNNISFSNLYIG